jgi:tetratricopeptide (TPR) repeat protein
MHYNFSTGVFKCAVLLLAISFTSLVSAQNNSSSTYIQKANDLLDKKKYEEALETLNQGILEMPDSVNLYDMRGALLDAFGLFEKAITDYTTAINKSTDQKQKAHFYSNRGGTKQKIRDFEGAYKDCYIAVKLDSTNIHALNNLATTCDEVNKPEEVFIYLHKILEIDSTYVPAYVNLGFRHQMLEKHQEAIAYFDKALELSPEEPLGYSNRSYSKLKVNDLKGAMKDINKSIKLLPANSYAYRTRALIYIEKDKLKNACEDLDLAEKLGFTKQYGNEVKVLKRKHCDTLKD